MSGQQFKWLVSGITDPPLPPPLFKDSLQFHMWHPSLFFQICVACILCCRLANVAMCLQSLNLLFMLPFTEFIFSMRIFPSWIFILTSINPDQRLLISRGNSKLLFLHRPCGRVVGCTLGDFSEPAVKLFFCLLKRAFYFK